MAGARHQHRSSGVPRAARRAASPAPPVGAATLSVAPGVPSQRGRLAGALGPASSRLRRRRRALPAGRGGRHRPGRGDRPGGSRAVQVGLRRTRPGRAGPGGGDGAAAPPAVRSPGPEAGPARRWQRRRSGPLSPPPEQERAAAAEQRRKATRISGAGRQAISAGAAPDPQARRAVAQSAAGLGPAGDAAPGAAAGLIHGAAAASPPRPGPRRPAARDGGRVVGVAAAAARDFLLTSPPPPAPSPAPSLAPSPPPAQKTQIASRSGASSSGGARRWRRMEGAIGRPRRLHPAGR